MNIKFDNSNDLVPVIIQDNTTLQVLMLGFMNEEAFQKTLEEKRVTFFSRSKQRLWTKGETSGNFLEVISMFLDCDSDTILIKATPKGPTCHKGTTSCFADIQDKGFIYQLEETIEQRINSQSAESYTSQLFSKGINKIAQKVGEEAIELIIEAKDENNELFINESADFLFHFLVLLKAKGIKFEDIEHELVRRSQTNA